MSLDLDPVIRLAIMLSQASEDIDRWSIDLLGLQHGLSDASPSEIRRRCERLRLLWIPVNGHIAVSSATEARIRERLERDDDHPEVSLILHRQLKQSKSLGVDIMRLRRQMNDFEMMIGGALLDYEKQSVDSRIIRLTHQGDTFTLDEIHDMVIQDHKDVADAKAYWRQMHSSAPTFIIRGSDSREAVGQALRRLTRTGHVVRGRSGFAAVRWSIPIADGQVRLQA